MGVSVIAFRTDWSFFYHAPIGSLITPVVSYLFSLHMHPRPAEKIRGYVL
jgi:hypothetical protein